MNCLLDISMRSGVVELKGSDTYGPDSSNKRISMIAEGGFRNQLVGLVVVLKVAIDKSVAEGSLNLVVLSELERSIAMLYLLEEESR